MTKYENVDKEDLKFWPKLFFELDVGNVTIKRTAKKSPFRDKNSVNVLKSTSKLLLFVGFKHL